MFGDVVQTVTRDQWTQGVSVAFTAPKRGNLLVLRCAEPAASNIAAPAGWLTALSVSGAVGADTCALAIFWKLSDGTETSAAPTYSGVGGSSVFQEIDVDGAGVRLRTASSAAGSDAVTSQSCLSSNYDNAIWPDLIFGAVCITHAGTRPNTIAGSTQWSTAPYSNASSVPAFDLNNNFASCGVTNWLLTGDQAGDDGQITWNNQNTARAGAAVFEFYASPFPIDFPSVSAQVTGTGTTLTPDISSSNVQAGDLVLCQVTNRNNNTPTAPASQGWSQVYTHSRAAGTAFNDTVFAKVWGIPGNTDDTTPTFTVASGTLGWGATLAVIRNPFNAWQPWQAVSDAILFQATDNATAAAATATAPSATITRPAPGRTYLRFFATADDNALGSPSEGTELYGGASYDQTTGDDFSQAASWVPHQDNAASTGTATVTETVNGNDVALTGTLVLGVEPRVPWRNTRVAPSQAAIRRSTW